jgi:hypothetical protein
VPLAPVISTALTTPTTLTGIGIYVGGRSFTGDVKWDTLSITDGGTNARGQLVMTIMLPISGLAEVYDQAQVVVVDWDAGTDPFRGYVVSRRPFVAPNNLSWTEVTATDIGSLLDDAFIAYESRPAESMQARIGRLWGQYASNHLSRDMSKVASVGGTLAASKLVSLTLRQAIEATISQASSSADYYVDTLGKLHVFTSESNDAPYNIDADSPGAGEIAPLSLEIDYDSGSYANQVYVQGFNAAGSGYFLSGSAIAAANGLVRTAVIQAPDCDTAAMALNLATMYLGRVNSGKGRGRFTTKSTNDGWRAGQNVLITSSDLGLTNSSFRIARVTTTILRPGSTPIRGYDVEFGGSAAGEEGI